MPQVCLLWRLWALLRSTQGLWKFWGDWVGICGDGVGVRSILCSNRGLRAEWFNLLCPIRLLSESDRSGGGGGRLVLQREMREDDEGVLEFLGSDVKSSEHDEDRPEGGQLLSGVGLLPSPWMLELGEGRGR